MSRPVYKALHNIPALQHLYLRMHSGPSMYQRPPPLQSLGVSQSALGVAQKLAGLLTYLGSPPSVMMKTPKVTTMLALQGMHPEREHGPPTISGFKNLKSLSVLDMDSLDYIEEIKICIQNSSSTLNKLQLSFSESLARKARKPPPVDDTGDESDQEMDEFGNMIQPPPAVTLPSTDDATGPAKAFRALEAKKAQEAVLGKIFGIESKIKQGDLSSSNSSDEDKEARNDLENSSKAFIRDVASLSKKMMGAANGDALTQQQKEFMDLVEKGAKKLVAEKKGALKGKSSKGGSVQNSTAGSSTAKITPVSSSVASVAGKADEEDKSKSPEPEEKSVGLFDGEDKKVRKAHHSTSDGPNPDDIDIYEPEVESDSQDVDDGSASELLSGETADDAKLPQQIGTSSSGDEILNHNQRVKDQRVLAGLQDDLAAQCARLAELKESMRKTAPKDNVSPEQKDNAMSEYVRTTRGLTLKTLSIYLIPIKTSVLSKAVDLHVLKRISLLNVGPQAPFWNYLAKENKVSPLPLCKIHTDNVTIPFLKFVNRLDNLVELFILERTTKSSEYSFAPKTTVTNDNIRHLVIKKHASSLKRLVVKNENDYSWDANEKFLELLCRKGKNLEELGISFASLALVCNVSFQLTEPPLPSQNGRTILTYCYSILSTNFFQVWFPSKHST